MSDIIGLTPGAISGPNPFVPAPTKDDESYPIREHKPSPYARIENTPLYSILSERGESTYTQDEQIRKIPREEILRAHTPKPIEISDIQKDDRSYQMAA